MALLICWSVFCTTQKNQQNAITGFRKWSHFAKCWKGNWWKLTTFHFCRSLTLSPPPCLAPFFSRLENINPEETDMVSPLENFMWSCRFFSIPLQWDCVIWENDLLISNLSFILCLKSDTRNLLTRIKWWMLTWKKHEHDLCLPFLSY